MIAVTTLNKIRENSHCEREFETLLRSLSKTEADDEPLTLEYILKSNGLDDAIWCLKACGLSTEKLLEFSIECAESVLHIFESQYPNDSRPRQAIEAAKEWLQYPSYDNARLAFIASDYAFAAHAISITSSASAALAAYSVSAYYAEKANPSVRYVSDSCAIDAAAAAYSADPKTINSIFIKHFCTEEK